VVCRVAVGYNYRIEPCASYYVGQGGRGALGIPNKFPVCGGLVESLWRKVLELLCETANRALDDLARQRKSPRDL
jgi:hypothetical protein